MKKSIVAAALTLAFAAPAMAQEKAASPHTFAGNVTLATDYAFRGISQTNEKPAIQGGFDYSHASGFYLGIWGSNVSWLADLGGGISSSVELDVYGGYKGAISEDLGYDVGVLAYRYPGTYPTGFTDADTVELYGALTWKMLTLKYSRATTDLFGVPDSDGSGYLELNASFDLGDGWSATAHVGKQRVKNLSAADYSDWKIGIAKALPVGTLGLAYTDTDIDGSKIADGRLILTYGATF